MNGFRLLRRKAPSCSMLTSPRIIWRSQSSSAALLRVNFRHSSSSSFPVFELIPQQRLYDLLQASSECQLPPIINPKHLQASASSPSFVNPSLKERQEVINELKLLASVGDGIYEHHACTAILARMDQKSWKGERSLRSFGQLRDVIASNIFLAQLSETYSLADHAKRHCAGGYQSSFRTTPLASPRSSYSSSYYKHNTKALADLFEAYIGALWCSGQERDLRSWMGAVLKVILDQVNVEDAERFMTFAAELGARRRAKDRNVKENEL